MYRTPPPKPPMPTGRASDVSTPTIITVNDGATTRIAFPCFYAYRPDGMPVDYRAMSIDLRDHMGWPEPDRPDRSAQPQALEEVVIEPIHLADEGYQYAWVALPEIDGVQAEATIDDNVVRMVIDCGVGWDLTEPLEMPFMLLVTTTDDEAAQRDVVTTGLLRVLPMAGMMMIGEDE